MTISSSTSNSSQSNTPNIDDINSIHHSLYFYHNDHPCLIHISKKLIGSENYIAWKRSMMIAVNAMNKLTLVNRCVYVCVYVDYVGVGTQSIERDRLIRIGVVLDNSFRSLLSDGEMIIEI
ncbi:cysteine-rich receptor-like protein kinase 8 [Tanacetum coccineum]